MGTQSFFISPPKQRSNVDRGDKQQLLKKLFSLIPFKKGSSNEISSCQVPIKQPTWDGKFKKGYRPGDEPVVCAIFSKLVCRSGSLEETLRNLHLKDLKLKCELGWPTDSCAFETYVILLGLLVILM